MLERILLPLDGSATAESILVQVRQLLKHRDSEVILARVAEFHQSVRQYDLVALAEGRMQAKRYVGEMAARLAGEGVRVRPVVAEGYPAEAILKVASDEGATLIAMSTHGRTGLSRWVFGSVTEKVLRASDVPVLVIRSFLPSPRGEPTQAPREERTVRKILVPIDGSESSLAIVPHVTELAKLFGSTVLVAYVKETPIYPPASFAGATVGRPLDSLPPPSGPTVEEQLQLAAEKIASAGIETLTLTSGGDPASQILELAGQKMADLIAMSTHGRSGVSRWVLGSVTEKVLRASTVPMLIVRSKRKD